VQKDKQRSTKHTHKTTDRVTRTPLKTGGEQNLLSGFGSLTRTKGLDRIMSDINEAELI